MYRQPPAASGQYSLEGAAYGSFQEPRGQADPEFGGATVFKKGDSGGGWFLDKGIFLMFGIGLLTVLSALPVVDALEGLTNQNYVFWAGRNVPVTLLTVSVLIIILFLYVTEAFFGKWRDQGLHTVQHLVMMASLFITLLGLSFVMVSVPMASHALATQNDILYQCSNSQQTRNVRSYYHDLLELRLTPTCKTAYSVEDCEGYQEIVQQKDQQEKLITMSAYLKYMETEFRCSGFCYGDAGAGANLGYANYSSGYTGDNYWPSILDPLQLGRPASLQSTGSSSSISKSLGAVSAQGQTQIYPPTLFSSNAFTVSCDGAAARNMMIYARDTAYQTWYTGVVLIALSICLGLWDWSVLLK